MTHKSDVGTVVSSVMARGIKRKTTTSFIDGWTKCREMPCMDDFVRAYEAAELIAEREVFFVSEVAVKIKGYRGTLNFEHEGAPHFGVTIFRPNGSFFFVFGAGAKRTVECYYMGVVGDAVEACSKVASQFDFDFEDAYFDLRDAAIGKFGIPKEDDS